VLATGAAGAAVADAVARLLPHEDVVLLADHAYAPYAPRPARVVSDRVARLAAELAGDGAKVVVVASLVATLDGLDATRRRAGIPVVGLESPIRAAGVATAGGLVAAIVGERCVRPLPYLRALRRERGGAHVAVRAWPRLRELAEAGAGSSPAAAALAEEHVAALRASGVAALALVCPHASALRAPIAAAGGIPVVDTSELTALRVRQVLRSEGLVARRRRAGRRLLVSSHPARAGGMAAAVRRGARA
jgi:glutamate racemase